MTATSQGPDAAGTVVPTYQLYCGGEWTDARSGNTFDDLDPFTGELWARVQEGVDALAGLRIEMVQECLQLVGRDIGLTLLERLRGAFDAGRTRPLEWRREQLQAIRALVQSQSAGLATEVAETDYDVEDLKTRRRRGRPPMGSGPADVVPVRIDPELRAAIEARAEKDHATVSDVIREAIRRFLDVA